jgi:hypothetical protein
VLIPQLARIALAMALLAGALLLPAGAAHAVDVWGDDDRDRYVGTGGLILPGTVDETVRREVASCAGCAWRLTSPCVTSDLGTPFDGQPACMSVVRGCPGGELLRSWFRPSGQPWRETGLICQRAGGPVTVARVGGVVADRIEETLPALSPGFQPARGVVAQLPVLFRSGQPRGATAIGMVILGQSVGITATPSWLWHFGDGAQMRTGDPGGVFPHGDVSHVYRQPGPVDVICTTHWAAEFTVDGLGPFPVEPSVLQSAIVRVDVGEGRALLTTPGRTPPFGMTQWGRITARPSPKA